MDGLNVENDVAEWVERYRAGDSQAAEKLFNRYVPRLIGLVQRRISRPLARRIDAEDVIQSAFLSFFAGLQNEKYQVDETGDLWRLLAVISLSKLRKKVEFHQAAKRSFDLERSVAASPTGLTPEHYEVVAKQPLPEAATAMVEELQALTTDFDPLAAEIVRLRMLGYQVTEIAEEVERSERTVRRALERVRKRWIERAGIDLKAD